MTDVVAALIWRDDRFLICQRPAHKARALLWEFVGGKQESGETKQEALVRECKEELDVIVSVDDIFMEVEHVYPDITVHLTLYNSRIIGGELKLLEHNASAWITVDEIDLYNFCPADEEILQRLKYKQKAKRAAHMCSSFYIWEIPVAFLFVFTKYITDVPYQYLLTR